MQAHAGMKDQRPIPIAHPAIVIVSLVLISTMLMWSYLTDLQGPPEWMTMMVVSLVIGASVISRRQRSRTETR